MSQQKNIEAIYPLAPMQQGMLFHAIAAPGAGDYINQLNMILPELQVDSFKQAWQQAVQRHPILRTLFVWEGRPQPLQVVRKTVVLNWSELDWRDQPAAAQQAQLTDLLRRERRQDFVLGEAPLMRFTLARRTEYSYEFIWTYHHLITDGWSLAILFKEVFALYDAARLGAPLTMATPRPFGDYIAWLQKQDRKSAEAFWRSYLKGFAAPTPLLPAAQSTADDGTAAPLHAEEGFLFSAALLAELRTVARAHQLTLNTLFMGAWGILLSRYSGETDVLFGTVVAGRPPSLAGVETMVGVFINTLPLRIRVDEDAAPWSWLQALQQQQVDRERFGYASLMDIQKWSELPAGTRLFENIAVFENYPIQPSSQAQRVQVSAVDQTNLPLELLILLEDATSFKLGYDPQRFTADTIRRLGSHYQTIVQSLISDLTQRLRDVQMMTAAEQHYLRVEWNATTTSYPHERTIHALFEEQVRRTPAAVAVSYGDQQLSYAELNRRANQLARHLQKLGVCSQPAGGPLVGLCVERSLDMIVGMLAILKAGGAYVPLDPTHPQERLAFMLSDMQAPVVLTQTALQDRLPESSAVRVVVDATELATYASEDLDSTVLPTHRAYVMYTSGSTGQPKGAVIPHRAVVRLVKQTNYVEFTPQDRVAQAASAAFDASTFEIWGALLNGAQLVGLERDDMLAPHQLVACLRDRGITAMVQVPALVNPVVALIPDAFRSLRFLIIGGDALDPGTTRQILRHGRPTHLVNGYGPTENTTFSVCHEITALAEDATTVPIGRPIANSQAYLLDKQLRLVPLGVTGDLYVGGDGLAQGYLNRPELTAEKFIEHAFAPAQPPTRLYKTGDLARYRSTSPNADASSVVVEFIGRADNQVKLRGFRIELGEIEAVLSQHPAVQEAAVVVHKISATGSQRLVAYVVLRPQAAEAKEPPGTSLQSYLQQKLPEHMVPATFVIQEALPLSPNGKIDRRALAAQRIDHKPTEHFAEAQTAIESTLVKIWQEALRVPQVGIHDNFFELGGDSILSIQVTSRARKAGLHFTAKQLFQKRTIAELAKVVTTATGPAQPAQSVVTGLVELTPIQRWFFAQSPTNPHHFNQSTFLEVAADTSPALLHKVLQKLQVHHDALRLRYQRTATGWQQSQAAPSSEAALVTVDLSELPRDAQDSAVSKQIAALQGSLNIEEGPLLRAALFQLGPRRPARLFISVHHLAVDGVSWRILLEDLQTAYQQISQGQDIVLPAKTTAFQAWAHWLTEAGVAMIAPQLADWLARLPRLASALPQDHTIGANTVAAAQHVTRALSRELTRALLQEAPAAYHTQVNDLLLTALMQTMTAWTGELSLLLALESHGREELHSGLDLSRTIGWFTTLYPVHLTLSAIDQESESAIKSIKEQLRQVPQNGIGYGVLRYLGSATALAELPEPQISFNYMGQFDQVQKADAGIVQGPAEGSCEPEVSPLNTRTRLLDVSGIVIGGQLEIDFVYSANFHQRSTMERLVTRYMEALTALIEHCCAPSAGGYTPSDFPESKLDQAGLDSALAAIALENASES